MELPDNKYLISKTSLVDESEFITDKKTNNIDFSKIESFTAN